MAAWHTASVLLVAVLWKISISGSYGKTAYEDELDAMDRGGQNFASSTYSVTRYVPTSRDKTIADCDVTLRTKFQVQFSAVKYRNKQWYAHIVKKTPANERGCFEHRFNSTCGFTFAQCLENAHKFETANSFHYNPTNQCCDLYSNWRKHKFRTCKRAGAGDSVYYVAEAQPKDFKACDGVHVAISGAYLAGGSNMQLTATLVDNRCCCEIQPITIAYLDKTGVFTSTGVNDVYTFTYPAADAALQPWQNGTRATVKEVGQPDYLGVGNFYPLDLLTGSATTIQIGH